MLFPGNPIVFPMAFWVPGYINLGRVEDLGSADRSVEAMQLRAWEVLDEAWRLGVRYFEPWRPKGRRAGGGEELGSWEVAV